MKKQNTNFNFAIGHLSDNDPFTRVLKIEGKSIDTIYKSENQNILLANVECLKELSNYINKIAKEYEDATNIK